MTTNREWLYSLDVADLSDWFDAEHVDNQFRDATKMTNLEWLFIDSEQFRQAVSAFAFAHSDECPTSPTQMVDWLMAEHVDAQRDTNGTCPNGNETASNGGDSREKLEADVYNHITIRITPNRDDDGVLAPYATVLEWLDRQVEITRKTEQAEWIQQANGLIHEANARADELQVKVDELRDELAKRDKGIERLKRQCDTARVKIDELHAECDTCCYKTDYIEMDFCDVDRLEAERDALAADLRDCEQQRERLRQALGCAIDHAHEITRLVNIDGEVA